MLEIKIIEHTSEVVAGYHRDVGTEKLAALGIEASDGRGARNLIGRQSRQRLPELCGAFKVRFRYHPAGQQSGLLHRFGDGEKGCEVNVSFSIVFKGDGIRSEAAVSSPFRQRTAEEYRRGISDGTAHRVVETVGSDAIGRVAYRHYVDACSLRQAERPVVAGHSGDDIVRGHGPARSHMAVLDPYIIVVRGQRGVHQTVLHKQSRIGLGGAHG